MSVSAYPVPLELSPSWSFDGDDGNWSTFAIGVGTPAQTFRVLPSTSGSETWVPLPQGCQGILANVSDCGDLRGVNDVNNAPSSGFQTNASSSWQTIGIYELSTEQALFGTGDDGLYGRDTLMLDLLSTSTSSANQSQNLSSQTIAGVATADFWLGSLGLGTATGNFTVQSENIPSLLDTLKSQGLIPSLSFGYTAGAVYSSPKDYGSLVLGGYDQARFTSSNLSMPLGGSNNQTVELSLESIVAQNVFGGTLSLLTSGNPIITVLDATVSQLWLPQSVCDLFAQAFGLAYDPLTDLYLVNSTIHGQLLDMNPSVTFTVAGNSTLTSSTTNIEFPYSAFDLQAGIPIYNSSTSYFPIRVAANESQYVLGRTFLQEAYVFVDWERQNFTLGQAIHQNTTKHIVPVHSPSDDTSGSTQTQSLSPGVIAGIAVAAGAAVAVATGIILCFVLRGRRRRRVAKAQEAAAEAEQAAAFLPDKKEDPYETVAELHSEHVQPPEIMSEQVYELQDRERKNELMSTPITELPGHAVGQELDGSSEGVPRDEKDKSEQKGVSNSVYELP
ncbi:hypothetical protein LTR85_007702 [Meristemomyces frigidus]|nr:hypothetical protein LTR85_007702 [Meristemomyces frigidus]